MHNSTNALGSFVVVTVDGYLAEYKEGKDEGVEQLRMNNLDDVFRVCALTNSSALWRLPISKGIILSTLTPDFPKAGPCSVRTAVDSAATLGPELTFIDLVDEPDPSDGDLWLFFDLHYSVCGCNEGKFAQKRLTSNERSWFGKAGHFTFICVEPRQRRQHGAFSALDWRRSNKRRQRPLVKRNWHDIWGGVWRQRQSRGGST